MRSALCLYGIAARISAVFSRQIARPILWEKKQPAALHSNFSDVVHMGYSYIYLSMVDCNFTTSLQVALSALYYGVAIKLTMSAIELFLRTFYFSVSAKLRTPTPASIHICGWGESDVKILENLTFYLFFMFQIRKQNNSKI